MERVGAAHYIRRLMPAEKKDNKTEYTDFRQLILLLKSLCSRELRAGVRLEMELLCNSG